MAFKQPRRNGRKRIFISYRRQGGIDTARWLYDQLTARGYDIFMDLEGLRSGMFNQALYQEIANRDVFLLIMSEGALDRCQNEGDWVRNEIAHALRCGRMIIPIFLKNAQFPDKLPEDIAPVRSYHGLPVSYDFFEAFMNQLVLLIDGDTPSPFKWKHLAAGAAAVALLFGVFLLGRLGKDDPATSNNPASILSTATQTEAPTQVPETSTPTEAPTEATYPAPTNVEPVNNSITNLCNGGLIFDNGTKSIWITSPHIRWYNFFPEQDISFRYDTSLRAVRTAWNTGEESLICSLIPNVDCRYLGVTENWLYCVLMEDSIANLYRATNDTENHSIGELELIVEDIIANNQVAIHNGYIYYWKYGKGLYRCHCDGTNAQLLWIKSEGSSCKGYVTFQVTDNFLYFRVSTGGIYTVPITGGNIKYLVNTNEQTAVVTHAVMQDGRLFFIMEYDDGSAPAELWSAETDGANVKRLAVLEDINTKILMLNAGVNSTLYLCAESEQGMYLYKFFVKTNTLALEQEFIK